MILKWHWHVFLAFFFYETNPPKLLINRLKWFCWKIRFRGDIHEISDSAQTNTVRSQTVFFSQYLGETIRPTCWFFFTKFGNPQLTPRRLTALHINFVFADLSLHWKKIWISPRKRNFQQNYFSLFIRGPGGFDSRKKITTQILWHCHFNGGFFLE